MAWCKGPEDCAITTNGAVWAGPVSRKIATLGSDSKEDVGVNMLARPNAPREV